MIEGEWPKNAALVNTQKTVVDKNKQQQQTFIFESERIGNKFFFGDFTKKMKFQTKNIEKMILGKNDFHILR